jgi:hypothetical protein
MKKLNLAKRGDLLGDFPDNAAPDKASDEKMCIYYTFIKCLSLSKKLF